MKKYGYIFLLLCFHLSLFAQKASEKKANALFEKKSYVKAAEIYEQVPENQKVLQNLGDCYYNNSQMKEAVRVGKRTANVFLRKPWRRAITQKLAPWTNQQNSGR